MRKMFSIFNRYKMVLKNIIINLLVYNFYFYKFIVYILWVQ